jgi:hypothetical protein
VSRRTLVAVTGAVLALALAGAAVAAALAIDADSMTLVRVPGAVPPQTCTLPAVSDAHVDEAMPDASFGAHPELAVASGPSDRRSFVRFDIAACSIPSNAEILSASLRLALVAPPSEDRTWKVRRVTGAWADDVTWNAEPSLAAASTDETTTGTGAGTLEWDVGPDVAAVVSGAVLDRGWRIADADEASPVLVGGDLASIEYADPADRPALTVAWFD